MRRSILSILLLLTISGLSATAFIRNRVRIGRQCDGSFVVATEQRVLPGAIAFNGRPIDLALHPSGDFFAVLNQGDVFLANRSGVIPRSRAKLAGRASYRGCVWHPSGQRLYVSLSRNGIQQFRLEGQRLIPQETILLAPAGDYLNPVPGGMVTTHDGRRLFVACASRGTAVEVDLVQNRRVRDWKVQNVPFEAKLSEDERTLIVSNWAGREPEVREDRAESGGVDVAVDRRGIPRSGTVSLIDLRTGRRRDVPVGLHPAGLAVAGGRAYVANAGSDTVSEIEIARATVTRTFTVRRSFTQLFGSMPNSLAIHGDRLYVCDGGDNAVSEIDLSAGAPCGCRPAGFYPVAIQVNADGRTAFVVNTKGNGSVRRTAQGLPGNVHDSQGTVSVIDLTLDLRAATRRAMRLALGFRLCPPMYRRPAVYNGAIKHVLYIIKENRTYDQVLGDMPQGNGDLRLCLFGENTTPNHHAIAREFTLFDNAYVSGTNSAEGHQWATEGLANDYIERFYGDYSRSYPYDGGDAMAYASSGFIWDAAVKKARTVRVYGEFCGRGLARFNRRPPTWLEAWKDRCSGANRIHVSAHTSVAGLRKLIHPNVIGWPLVMSDQWRADKFIEEYRRLSRENRVPNLMMLTLPADHTEGLNPGYPTPAAMIADNDLALGRVIEAVSRSPQWKNTCIFVMEDDAQAGLDHVDGHRTVCLVASPYVRRGSVDSTLYTQISVLHSIELMLGLSPMNTFDALATPFRACFTDTPDLRPYVATPNRIALDQLNPPIRCLQGFRRDWAKRSARLDWSDVDSADWEILNQALWHDARGEAPYPVLN